MSSTAAPPSPAFVGTTQKCTACEKTVYPVEELAVDGEVYHRACFRCQHCKATLKFSSYISREGVLYCKPHYDQFFITRGTTRSSRTDKKTCYNETITSRIASMFVGTQEKCVTCGETVYPIEKVAIDGNSYHRKCFKCSHGGCVISPSNYIAHEGRLYCRPHHTQLFMEKGDFSRLEEWFPGNTRLAVVKENNCDNGNSENDGSGSEKKQFRSLPVDVKYSFQYAKDSRQESGKNEESKKNGYGSYKELENVIKSNRNVDVKDEKLEMFKYEEKDPKSDYKYERINHKDVEEEKQDDKVLEDAEVASQHGHESEEVQEAAQVHNLNEEIKHEAKDNYEYEIEDRKYRLEGRINCEDVEEKKQDKKVLGDVEEDANDEPHDEFKYEIEDLKDHRKERIDCEDIEEENQNDEVLGDVEDAPQYSEITESGRKETEDVKDREQDSGNSHEDFKEENQVRENVKEEIQDYDQVEEAEDPKGHQEGSGNREDFKEENQNPGNVKKEIQDYSRLEEGEDPKDHQQDYENPEDFKEEIQDRNRLEESEDPEDHQQYKSNGEDFKEENSDSKNVKEEIQDRNRLEEAEDPEDHQQYRSNGEDFKEENQDSKDVKEKIQDHSRLEEAEVPKEQQDNDDLNDFKEETHELEDVNDVFRQFGSNRRDFKLENQDSNVSEYAQDENVKDNQPENFICEVEEPKYVEEENQDDNKLEDVKNPLNTTAK